MADTSSLTARERETLRLLLAGHDAKSSARVLGLSVHTVNERLREARRKLGVSSSRAAARMLAEAEAGAEGGRGGDSGASGADPQLFGDKEIGVAGAEPGAASGGRVAGVRRGGWPLAWLGGGMLIMSLIVAVAAAAILNSSNAQPQGAAPVPPTPPAVASPAPETRAASDWLALVDHKKWGESWEAAGSAFQSLPKDRWAFTAQSVRGPLGPLKQREVQTVTRTTTLPGAPAGEYQVVQFRSTFAQKADAVETVVLSHEAAGWRVNGYFIR